MVAGCEDVIYLSLSPSPSWKMETSVCMTPTITAKVASSPLRVPGGQKRSTSA